MLVGMARLTLAFVVAVIAAAVPHDAVREYRAASRDISEQLQQSLDAAAEQYLQALGRELEEAMAAGNADATVTLKAAMDRAQTVHARAIASPLAVHLDGVRWRWPDSRMARNRAWFTFYADGTGRAGWHGQPILWTPVNASTVKAIVTLERRIVEVAFSADFTSAQIRDDGRVLNTTRLPK